MASYTQGYDEKRFVSTINRNFLCLICFNVLKDPVLCPRNQHCFCRCCITTHLENSRRCPTCADELTEETLIVPSRMVCDYLDESKIRCVYHDRGCQEVVQLQHLDEHEDSCGFTPAVCTNPGCGATLNKRDLVHHQSEVCEFRKLKCHSCEETTKTLANLENKMEAKFEVVNNDVKELKTALVEAFDKMMDFLVKIETNINKNATRVGYRPSAENIIVAGGLSKCSAEMFNWRQRTWSPLQSIPKTRYAATSFVHKNQVVIAGGYCARSGRVDDMIRMNVDPHPDLSTHWSECPVKLPTKLGNHSSVLYDDKLMVTGGSDGNAISDKIHEVKVVPPYTVKILSRMPEARRSHCMEIFDDSLLILGGRTTGDSKDNLSSVVLYDMKNNVCKQLAPLLYEVSLMATVRWGDNVVVIGGVDKHGNRLNTVIMYNVKTQQSHMLPPMRCKRDACAAVVVGNNIVVLGGFGDQGGLKSVECFNFERYTWQELPEMSQARCWHIAVVV